jgi:hypothetical protein
VTLKRSTPMKRPTKPMARGKPLSRNSPIKRSVAPTLKRTQRLRPVGKRRKRDGYAEARKEVVAFVHARDVVCQAPRLYGEAWARGDFIAGFPMCGGGVLDVHEVHTRGRGGSAIDPGNCLLLCRWHHRWVHGHPSEATTLRLLASGRRNDSMGGSEGEA